MWSAKETDLLRLVLDALIPPSNDGRVPGAGADVAGFIGFLATAGGYAHDPNGCVLRLLDFLARDSVDFTALTPPARAALLRRAEQERSADFATVLRLTYMRYYSRPQIRPLFGLSARPVHPDGYPVPHEDEALMRELTEPVRQRGAHYREAAEGAGR